MCWLVWSEMETAIAEKYVSVLEKLFGAWLYCVGPQEC